MTRLEATKELVDVLVRAGALLVRAAELQRELAAPSWHDCARCRQSTPNSGLCMACQVTQ